MKSHSRIPRAERLRYRKAPLPFGVRVVLIVTGWFLVVLGIVGLFLPILQGGLSLALGLALLSIASQTVHLKLRQWMRRWPGGWKRMEKLRRRLIRRLTRGARGGDSAAPPPDS